MLCISRQTVMRLCIAGLLAVTACGCTYVLYCGIGFGVIKLTGLVLFTEVILSFFSIQIHHRLSVLSGK